MNIRENILQIGIILVILLTIGAIIAMVIDLYSEAQEKQSQTRDQAAKGKGLSVNRQRYQSLVTDLEQFYTPVNVHTRNIFALNVKAGTGDKGEKVPDKIHPGQFQNIIDRLKVLRTFKKPVELLFKGYLQLGDGTYIATINWGGKTNFKKTGDEIRGYKMVDFKKEVKKEKTAWGGEDEIDLSTITLERAGGERLELQISKITLEKEIFAQVKDLKTGTVYDVHIGSEILNYKVVDIFPGMVIIIDSNNKRTQLQKS